MPLTAKDASGSVIDSTECSDEFWASIHKVKQKAELYCRACGSLMQPKNSSMGLRFFRHYVADDHCPSNGESPAHLDLKKRVAVLIRNSGGRAFLEATPSDGDEGGWRADVLAETEEGQRIAFEIQLAGMTLGEGLRRSEQYRRDGISVLWITTRKVHWMFGLPGVRVLIDQDRLLISHGLAMFRYRNRVFQPSGDDLLTNAQQFLDAYLNPEQINSFMNNFWRFPFCWHGTKQLLDMQTIIAGLLKGSVLSIRVDSFMRDPDSMRDPITPAVVVVSRAHLEESQKRQSEYDQRLAAASLKEANERERRERGDRAKEAEVERRRKHIEELHDRQTRVLGNALVGLVQEIPIEVELMFGIPPEKWSLDIDFHPWVRGNEETGFGVPIWTSQKSTERHLVGVVYPVASRVDSEFGELWNKEDVVVYVETLSEAGKVAQALGWNEFRSKVTRGDTSSMLQLRPNKPV